MLVLYLIKFFSHCFLDFKIAITLPNWKTQQVAIFRHKTSKHYQPCIFFCKLSLYIEMLLYNCLWISISLLTDTTQNSLASMTVTFFPQSFSFLIFRIFYLFVLLTTGTLRDLISLPTFFNSKSPHLCLVVLLVHFAK